MSDYIDSREDVLAAMEWRGHAPNGDWTAAKLAGDYTPGEEITCRYCGKAAGRYAKGYGMVGEAVAVNCPGPAE